MEIVNHPQYSKFQISRHLLVWWRRNVEPGTKAEHGKWKKWNVTHWGSIISCLFGATSEYTLWRTSWTTRRSQIRPWQSSVIWSLEKKWMDQKKNVQNWTRSLTLLILSSSFACRWWWGQFSCPIRTMVTKAQSSPRSLSIHGHWDTEYRKKGIVPTRVRTRPL